MGRAQQVEALWNGLRDSSGNPLASGRVYAFAAGTATPKALFTASDKSSSATHPLVLDGSGRSLVWADGAYKLEVRNSADVLQYTLDNLVYGYDDGEIVWGATSAGTGNAQTISVSGAITSYSAGQRFIFIAGNSNTGAATLNVNSIGPVGIVKGPASATLGTGDIRSGQLVDVVYETGGGGRFRLMSYPTLQEIQNNGPVWLGTTGGSGNAQTASASPAITAYAAGQIFRFVAGATNTGAMTLAINGLTAQNVFDVATNAALRASQVLSGFVYEVIYTGAQFVLLNPNQGYITGFSPVITQGATVSKTDNYSAYRIVGNMCHYQYGGVASSAGTASNIITITLPIAAAANTYRNAGSAMVAKSGGNMYSCSAVFDNSGAGYVVLANDASTTTWFGASPAVTLGNLDGITLNVFYQI